jgi:hypothetical protein
MPKNDAEWLCLFVRAYERLEEERPDATKTIDAVLNQIIEIAQRMSR